MNCPICGKVMTEYRDVLDGWCLMESRTACPDGCYSDEYLTGEYRETVKDKLFSWHYTTPRNEVEEIEKEISAAIAKAKREAPANPA